MITQSAFGIGVVEINGGEGSEIGFHVIKHGDMHAIICTIGRAISLLDQSSIQEAM